MSWTQNFGLWIIFKYSKKLHYLENSQYKCGLISTIYVDGFLFSASMIAMAQAIMKIISKISLTRMNLMVNIMAYNTQIAGKKLFPIDQNMNINHFQALSKTIFFYWIRRRINIHSSSDRNYLKIKKSSIQNFRKSFKFSINLF